ARGEAAPERDRRGSGNAGDDGDPERTQDEPAQVRRLPLPTRHGDAELAQEAREDGHGQYGEHERAAAVRVQEAALEHDERERERRREAAEDERLDRTGACAARTCHLLGPDEVRRDGRRDVRCGRGPNGRRRLWMSPGPRRPYGSIPAVAGAGTAGVRPRPCRGRTVPRLSHPGSVALRPLAPAPLAHSAVAGAAMEGSEP